MQLSADEIDLIDAWFAGGQPAEQNSKPITQPSTAPPAAATQRAASPIEEPAAATYMQDTGSGSSNVALGERTARWWQETTTPRDNELGAIGDNDRAEEFPRIVRNRLKA